MPLRVHTHVSYYNKLIPTKEGNMELNRIFSERELENLRLLEELRVKGGYKTKKEALDALIKWKKNK